MSDVLDDKKSSTRYRILLEVADRQPAVSQKEIAEEVGVTVQSVSDYLNDMKSQGLIVKKARGSYQVTKEGVDWLMSRTEELEEIVDYVNSQVVDRVDTELVLAEENLREGDKVALRMEDGLLKARNKNHDEQESTQAVVASGARKGGVTAVTDFDGVLDYSPGEVEILAIQDIDDIESAADFVERHHDGELTAAHEIQGLVAVKNSDLDLDIRYGVREAVVEATNKGEDVLLVTVENEVSGYTGAFRENGIDYRVTDGD